MLWVYGHYKYFNSYSARIDFSYRRQNLTSTDVRFWRMMYIPALQELYLFPDIDVQSVHIAHSCTWCVSLYIVLIYS